MLQPTVDQPGSPHCVKISSHKLQQCQHERFSIVACVAAEPRRCQHAPLHGKGAGFPQCCPVGSTGHLLSDRVAGISKHLLGSGMHQRQSQHRLLPSTLPPASQQHSCTQQVPSPLPRQHAEAKSLTEVSPRGKMGFKCKKKPPSRGRIRWLPWRSSSPQQYRLTPWCRV